MAGHPGQSPMQADAKRAMPVHLRVASACLRTFSREISMVELQGRNFYAMVPKGSTFNQRLSIIAEKYGGGFAMLNYAGMGDELVAVRLGDCMMVKGEPEKVAKADFSSFGDSAGQFRDIAVEHARGSKGGIHIFAGKSGIPVAIDAGGNVIFPNGDEIKGPSVFSLQLVDYDKDPKKVSDLTGGSTGKPPQISPGAESIIKGEMGRDKLAQAHGGGRSGNIIIEEEKLLIFDFLSGQLSTVSEFVAKGGQDAFRAEKQYASAEFASRTSQQPGIGLVYPTPSGPVLLPLDGCLQRVPYLFVQVFDGRIQDKLRLKNAAFMDAALRDCRAEGWRQPDTLPAASRPTYGQSGLSGTKDFLFSTSSGNLLQDSMPVLWQNVVPASHVPDSMPECSQSPKPHQPHMKAVSPGRISGPSAMQRQESKMKGRAAPPLSEPILARASRLHSAKDARKSPFLPYQSEEMPQALADAFSLPRPKTQNQPTLPLTMEMGIGKKNPKASSEKRTVRAGVREKPAKRARRNRPHQRKSRLPPAMRRKALPPAASRGRALPAKARNPGAWKSAKVPMEMRRQMGNRKAKAGAAAGFRQEHSRSAAKKPGSLPALKSARPAREKKSILPGFKAKESRARKFTCAGDSMRTRKAIARSEQFAFQRPSRRAKMVSSSLFREMLGIHSIFAAPGRRKRRRRPIFSSL